MTSSVETFTVFQAAYLKGAELLEKERQKESPDLASVANTAFTALAAMPYGRALTDDRDLCDCLDLLEAGLYDWVMLMIGDASTGYNDAHPDIAWALDDDEESVRRFLYWGRLGEIFHHFRDQGRMMNTFWEKNTRTVVQQRADLTLEALATLSSDLIVQAVYDDTVLKRMTKVSELLQQLKIDLLHSPLEFDEELANPFQDSIAIIRRQFLTVVSLMTFELFGNVSPAILERLLEIKSSTADSLGLLAWPLTQGDVALSRDSRKRMMRENLRGNLKLICSKARKHRWQSRSVIEYFAAHSELREELARRRERD